MFDLSNYHYNPHAIPVAVSGVLIFLIGLLIFWQTKRTARNVSFFLFCMGCTLWLVTMGFVYSANEPALALQWYKTLTFFGVINLMPNLYLFSVASSGLLEKKRFNVIVIYGLSYALYLAALFSDKFITAPHPYFWGYYPHYEPWNYFFLISFMSVYLACQANLLHAYRQEKFPVRKTQVRMIMIGLLFAITAFIDFAAKVWTVNIYPFGFASMTAMTGIIAYTIIKHRAFDIETVIHKTVLWVLSFAIVTVPLAVIYRWLFPVVEHSVNLQIAFGVLCFIVVTVYMRVYQPKIDHVFQRRKANLEEITSRFIENLVHLKGLNNLIRYIEETIDNTLYPQWIDIFVYKERQKKYVLANKKQTDGRPAELVEGEAFLKWLKENNQIVYGDFIEIDPQYTDVKDKAAGYFRQTGAAVVVPLIINEQLLGMIHLDKKASLRRYNALDFHFLTTLKNQSAIAISNSLIYQNIEEEVKQRTEELVEVQKQLTQAEKLATVGTLSGGVAHEINNPLTAILTNVQMLLSMCDEKGTEVDRESLELMEEATQRCRTIVHKLMAYAKKPLESDEFSKIDLIDVLNKVVSFLSYQLEQDNIKIKTKLEKGSLFVLGNHNELEQVFTNIILNARDAMVLIKKKASLPLREKEPVSPSPMETTHPD